MRRVVITGLGAITPLGLDVRTTWEALLAGKSGMAPITRFDAGKFDTRFAAEVKGFDPEKWIEKKEVKKMDLFIQYTIAASQQALDDSGITMPLADPERVGTIIGAGLGGLPAIEDQHTIYMEKGPGRISPFFVPKAIANLAPGYVSIRFGAKGPSYSPVSACATGNHSIGEAYRSIERDDADVVIAGSSESTICPLCVGGFNSMRALSTDNEHPTTASRPFDKDRTGFVLGEAAGIMILEELEHAKKRGAKIYGEMVGYGLTADANHITAPAPEGEGAKRCMKMSLRGLDLTSVDYINAHGTSTGLGDVCETQAIKATFGDHAKKLWVSSTKSMTGHALGGAGGIEGVFTTLAVHTGAIPPTINLDHPDPQCDLDYVPNKAREKKIRLALSNSFGFGGTNATLAIRHFEG
jgi:3-oxoacyl-[acyl-carrier-protein] synthase II